SPRCCLWRMRRGPERATSPEAHGLALFTRLHLRRTRRPLAPERFALGISRLDFERRRSIGNVGEAEVRIFRNRNPSLHAKQQRVALPYAELIHEIRRDIEEAYLIALQTRIVGVTDHDLRLTLGAARLAEHPKFHLAQVGNCLVRVLRGRSGAPP